MVVLIFFAVFIATYAITFLVWWHVVDLIIKLPRKAQVTVFVIITTILFTPIFSVLVVVVFPVPSLFFLSLIPIIGDSRETYRMVSMTGPLNIITPILTSIIAFKLASKILSKSFELDGAIKRTATQFNRYVQNQRSHRCTT